MLCTLRAALSNGSFWAKPSCHTAHTLYRSPILKINAKRNMATTDSALPPPPPYWEERVKLFEELTQQTTVPNSSKIDIRLADGKVMGGDSWKTTPMEIAKSLGVANTALVSKVDGKLWDLLRPLERSCNVEFFGFDTQEGKSTFWHSSAHVLGQVPHQQIITS